MRKCLFVLILVGLSIILRAQQNVGIGTATPHSSAQLEIQSGTKGLLIPRMTTADMEAIVNPAKGLIIYNTERARLCYFDDVWIEMSMATENVWSKNGNLIYKNNSGFVGIGTSNPQSLLHIARGSAGGVLPFGTPQLTLESLSDAAISMLSPDVRTSSIHFGINSNNFSGAITYNASFNRKGFDFRTRAGETKMVIDSLGNVGIGDLDPPSRLSIKTTEDFVARLEGGAGMYVGLYESNVFRGYLGSVSGNSADIDLGTAQVNIAGNLNLTTKAIPRLTITNNGTAQLIENNILEFGAGLTKETNAGKIGYNAFGKTALTFTGGGTTTGNRAIFFFAEGGTGYSGKLYINDPASGEKRIEMLPTESGADGAAVALYNAAGTKTIELDADYNDGDGRIITRELQINGGADLAEHFSVNNAKELIKPGMLVSIDPNHEGQLTITTIANDKKIVGVISGANGVKAGMLMSQNGTIADGDYPVALAGRVYVLANEEGGTISAGDFLTSSMQKGYAKKLDAAVNAQGTIIGKAMGKRDPKTGYVLVLVNLQ